MTKPSFHHITTVETELDGKHVTATFHFIPEDPTVGDPEMLEDLEAKLEDGTVLDLTPEQERILEEKIWEIRREIKEVSRCVRRYGYDKCFDTGIL